MLEKFSSFIIQFHPFYKGFRLLLGPSLLARKIRLTSFRILFTVGVKNIMSNGIKKTGGLTRSNVIKRVADVCVDIAGDSVQWTRIVDPKKLYMRAEEKKKIIISCYYKIKIICNMFFDFGLTWKENYKIFKSNPKSTVSFL